MLFALFGILRSTESAALAFRIMLRRRSLSSLCLSEFKLARTDDEVRREMA